jgi:integrase
MGCVYRPKGRKTWMIKWRDLNGKRHVVSSKSDKKEVAKRILRDKEHKTDQGMLVTPEMGKLKFSEGVKLLVDFHTARDRDTKKVEGRIAKHLTPYFGANRLMASITGDLVAAYIAKRKKDTLTTKKGIVKTVKNATINRELAWLKQMFTLSIRAGKLLMRPHIELLPEHNARQGFFEPEQFQAVLKHLPEELRPVAQFAYITGWRLKSEVLTREWRHVDFQNGTVHLLKGETKNREPRTFVMTQELRKLLEGLHAEAEKLKKRGKFPPARIFYRMVAKGRRGPLRPVPITSLSKAFASACRKAGCPGRIPHDLRRSAVRRFVRQGIPDSVAMKLTGHKTRSVFERYNIVSEGDLREAAAKLDAAASSAQAATASA